MWSVMWEFMVSVMELVMGSVMGLVMSSVMGSVMGSGSWATITRVILYRVAMAAKNYTLPGSLPGKSTPVGSVCGTKTHCWILSQKRLENAQDQWLGDKTHLQVSLGERDGECITD